MFKSSISLLPDFEFSNLNSRSIKIYKLLTKGSFQPNSTGVQNRCSQIFSKFFTSFNCFYERNISWKFQLHSSIQSHFIAFWSFRDCPKILVCKFLWFSGTPTFRELLLLVLLELFLESRPRIVSKTFRTKSWRPFYLWQLQIQFTKNCKKWYNFGQFCNFAIFSRLGVC